MLDGIGTDPAITGAQAGWYRGVLAIRLTVRPRVGSELMPA